MLNIRTRAVAETITFDLTDVDDAPLADDAGQPVRCTVYGPGSRRFQQASQRKACPPALPYCHCAFGTTGVRAPESEAGARA